MANMLFRLVVIASLVVCCLGKYPTAVVYFRDPSEHDGTYACCKGSYTEHIAFSENVQLDALLFPTRLPANDSDTQAYTEIIHVYLAQNYGEDYQRIAEGTHNMAMNPGQDATVNLFTLDDPTVVPVVEAGKDYFAEIEYQIPGTYPTYSSRDWTFGPFVDTSSNVGFIIGAKYSPP